MNPGERVQGLRLLARRHAELKFGEQQLRRRARDMAAHRSKHTKAELVDMILELVTDHQLVCHELHDYEVASLSAD